MQLPEICIKRPVFATVLSLIILLIGIISYTRLSVREYPRIDEPVVSVSTTYRGASAEVVESQVTKPLEDSLAGIEGVELMTSQSRSETSRINVRFSLKRDPDSAAADVRDKVARARGKLPDTIDEPIIAKVEADSQPVIYISVEAGDQSALEASDYVKRYVQPRLSVLPGAADVRIFGERQVSMHVDLDRTRLAAYRLTVQDVEDAIRRQNAEIPAGRIESQAREFTVVAETDLRSPEQFSNIIVANVGGYPVRIRDVGKAEIGPVNERTVSRFNGRPSLNIGVIKQAVANPLDLSKAVRAEVEKINEGLPPGMKLIVSYDTSVFIDRSIKSVFETIGEAIAARGARDLLLPAQPARHDHPDRDHPGLARRRVRAHVRVRLHDQHADAARDGARDRPRRRRRHRDAREHLPARRGRHAAQAGGDPRRARDRVRDPGDDAHADVGVRAARVRDRPHRAPLHRVRAHARGRGAGVGLRRADAIADDVLAPAAARDEALDAVSRDRALAVRRSPAVTAVRLGATLHARWVVVIGWVVVLAGGGVLFASLKSELSPLEDRGVSSAW